jgi:hypothetical protein
MELMYLRNLGTGGISDSLAGEYKYTTKSTRKPCTALRAPPRMAASPHHRIKFEDATIYSFSTTASTKE